jgi:hypothetical protein
MFGFSVYATLMLTVCQGFGFPRYVALQPVLQFLPAPRAAEINIKPTIRDRYRQLSGDISFEIARIDQY